MIIVPEGPNACGKTTFIKLFKDKADELRNKLGTDAVPDVVEMTIKHTSIPHSVNEALKSRHTNGLKEHQLAYLVAGHLELIQQAKDQHKKYGNIVILDRSVASFYVYQHLLYRRNRSSIAEHAGNMYHATLAYHESDITQILMAYPVSILKQRILDRGDANHLLEDLEFISNSYHRYFTNVCPANYLIKSVDDVDIVIDKILASVQ